MELDLSPYVRFCLIHIVRLPLPFVDTPIYVNTIFPENLSDEELQAFNERSVAEHNDVFGYDDHWTRKILNIMSRI